ncbi:MMPL family transporter [Streptosporangium sp. NPDC000563]|uniref:MMPL family transporter n=1 Tax=Streptosporangium sp. NPDC000563 TaxID=3154366 RepID=UPI00331C754F
MSALLYRLGRWSFHARRTVVALWVLALAALIVGSSGFARPLVEGYKIPGTEAQRAMDDLAVSFPEASGSSAQMIVVVPPGQRADDAPVQRQIADAVVAIESVRGVASVSDPFAAGHLSGDGRAVLVPVQFSQASADIADATLASIVDVGERTERALNDGSRVAVGGEALGAVELPHDSAGEIFGLALAFLVLLATFGSFVAAGLPLLAAAIGVGVSLTAIEVATALVDVSSTAPVLATMLGLAVGIDYALFVLFRHMRHLRDGMGAAESIARAVATAGSAVVFAGLTVVIALVGLVIVDIPFLTAMGFAAAAAVGIAVVAALTLAPALMGFASPLLARGLARRRLRIERRAASRRRAHRPGPGVVPHASVSGRFFGGWVRLATARPRTTVALVIASVGLISIPALDLKLGLPDAGSEPVTSPVRETYDLITEHFGPGFNGPLLLTGPIAANTDPIEVMADIAKKVGKLEGVTDVPLAVPNTDGTAGLITVIPASAPESEDTKLLVRSLRALAVEIESEHGVDLSVTGYTAAGIDVSALLADALLPYIAFIVILSLILMTMVFRSIWVPVKATVGFLLTIGSAFGAVSLVYSWGWFAEPLGVEQTGPVITFMPIIALGVLFGLAMDYEVFLVSAMKEEHAHGTGAQAAITHGFLRSAPIVTAAALIMFAVFATFIPGADATIKPIALALAVGVFVDAFVVRMTFVPAVMKLLGENAWRMPKWLESRLPSFDVEGEGLDRRLADVAQTPAPSGETTVTEVSDRART